MILEVDLTELDNEWCNLALRLPSFSLLNELLIANSIQIIHNPAQDLAIVLTEIKNQTALGVTSKKLEKINPLAFDFKNDDIQRRIKSLKSEYLVKSCIHKKKPKSEQIILDGTGGTGTESLLLAATDVKVILFERNTIISLLLLDAKFRSGEEKIELNLISSVEQYKSDQQIDTIYLDPMFPQREKSALIKKTMQIFHQILNTNNHATEQELLAEQTMLFKNVLNLKPRRIVVKRPNYAPPIFEKVSYEIKSKKFRFDVYQL